MSAASVAGCRRTAHRSSRSVRRAPSSRRSTSRSERHDTPEKQPPPEPSGGGFSFGGQAAARPSQRRGPGIARSTVRSSRSEEHTSELQSLMRNSYDAFGLKKKKKVNIRTK